MKFFLTVMVVLGGVALGAVWTRIEEFEGGHWSGATITQAIVVGLLFGAIVATIFMILDRRAPHNGD